MLCGHKKPPDTDKTTMDSQTKKAILRARMKEAAQKRDKRIDSPLVRYNELDQPVCKVCNVAIKSESLWPAHLASRKHNLAVENVKALSSKSAMDNDTKPISSHVVKTETRLSNSLPTGFFDKPDAKRQNLGCVSSGDDKVNAKTAGVMPSQEDSISSIHSACEVQGTVLGIISSSGVLGTSDKERAVPVDKLNLKGKESEKISSSYPSQGSNENDKLEGNQVKGSLPEGFFDNKDADLRARGLEPIKYDIKDEWKEFQKTIQEDLQEVDDRLEEEEFDAAEVREEMELLEQRAYMERVAMFKKQQLKLSAARASAHAKSPSYMGADSSEDDSGEDEDEDEDNYLVDWRAKHL